jgi:hypothetical protein
MFGMFDAYYISVNKINSISGRQFLVLLRILGEFAKLLKAIIRFVMSVRPRMKLLGFDWMNFYDT